VGLVLSFFAVELIEAIMADRASPSATVRRAMPPGPSRG
jgi:hypothetical protein